MANRLGFRTAGADPGGEGGGGELVGYPARFTEAHHKNLIREKKEIQAWVPKNWVPKPL